MKETAVARRYAKAFAETYKGKDDLETVLTKLNTFADLFEDNKDLRTALLNPAISLGDKENIVKAIGQKIDMGDTAGAMLQRLLEKDRIGIVGIVANEFEKIALDMLGRIRVDVTSATELDQEAREELTKTLSSLAGKEAIINIKVDPSLIGGVTARMGSVVYDGSIKNQLKALRVGLE